ncbi:MAG: hypothetical protein H7X95_14255 [Deltaproteobacteria bacterium]|nr:hypothetical protein [Deltaproteobacteria bacterium]
MTMTFTARMTAIYGAALALFAMGIAARAEAAPAPGPPASAVPASSTATTAAASSIPGSPVPGAGTSSPVPPTALTATGAPLPGPSVDAANAMGSNGNPAYVPRVVLTADAAAADSDHDVVVGRWGIEVHQVTTTLPVFSRRASTGCPLALPAAGAVPGTPAPASAPITWNCPPVTVSMLSVRHWVNRNLAWTVGAALALGGGTQGGRLLDSYFGFGPSAGVSVLLGNWRHLAVAASPALTLVWFKAAGSAAATYVADMRADLEGELHFGFIGAPALSLGIRSGILLRLEKAPDLSMWSAGVSGATTLRGLVSDLTLRYYF